MDREAAELGAAAMNWRRHQTDLPCGQPSRDHRTFAGDQEPARQRCAQRSQARALEPRIGDELCDDMQASLQQPVTNDVTNGTPIGGRIVPGERPHPNRIETLANRPQRGDGGSRLTDIGAQQLGAEVQTQAQRRGKATLTRQPSHTLPTNACPASDQPVEVDQPLELGESAAQQAGGDVKHVAIGMRTRKSIDSGDFLGLVQKIVRAEPIRFIGAYETPMQFDARTTKAFENEVKMMTAVNLDQRWRHGVLVAQRQQQPMCVLALCRPHQQVEIAKGAHSGARVNGTRQGRALEYHRLDPACSERGAKPFRLYQTERLMTRLAGEVQVEFALYRNRRASGFGSERYQSERVGIAGAFDQRRPRLGSHLEWRFSIVPNQGLQSRSNEHELALRKGRAL